MHTSTRGIVLHKTKYSESSLIVKVYTEHYGLQSYIIQGGRGKKSKTRATLFQPLAMLDMEVHHREKTDLQRIKEVKLALPFGSIPYDFAKSSIALFLTEILYKTLKPHDPDAELFEFLEGGIRFLDLTEESVANFHLLFLTRYSRYLGFYPQGEYTQQTQLFDLVEGTFRNSAPAYHLLLENPQSLYLSRLLGTKFEAIHTLNLPAEERKKLLRNLVDYYRVHIDGLKDIKSHEVLETVVGK